MNNLDIDSQTMINRIYIHLTQHRNAIIVGGMCILSLVYFTNDFMQTWIHGNAIYYLSLALVLFVPVYLLKLSGFLTIHQNFLFYMLHFCIVGISYVIFHTPNYLTFTYNILIGYPVFSEIKLITLTSLTPLGWILLLHTAQKHISYFNQAQQTDPLHTKIMIFGLYITYLNLTIEPISLIYLR